MNTPQFVIVGHPNKGKSSLVATLAQNDSVGISPLSGTTVQSTPYQMRLQGELCYQLVDTPGFQRSERLLALLQQQCESTTQRQSCIQQWLTLADSEAAFPDEVALLAPVMQEHSAIIYVVDGSKPYSSAYEAEMEILRWTGRPRMAVINPIAGESYVEQWQQALDQYFSLVRVFNPVKAPFSEQLALLDVFATLQPRWQQSISKAMEALGELREQRLQLALQQLISGLGSQLSHKVELCLPEQLSDSSLVKQQLFKRYQQVILEKDKQLRQQLIQSMNHLKFSDFGEAPNISLSDLFDEQQWQLWGISKKQLLLLATGSGALAGGVLDISLGGSSFMLGAAVGSVVSGGAAYYWSDELAKVKLLDREVSLGQNLWQVGPVKNLSFAWAQLFRYLFLIHTLLERSHANRALLSTECISADLDTFKQRLERLSKTERAKLNLWLQQPGHKVLKTMNISQLLRRLFD